MARRAAVLLFALAGLAAAQGDEPPPVTAHARLAFETQFRAGWVPVIIEDLRNFTDQDADVEVRLDFDPRLPTASTWLSVPRKGFESKKRAFLYLYNPGVGRGPKLTLRRRGDEKPCVASDVEGSQFYNQGIVVVSGRQAAAPMIREALVRLNTTNGYYNYNAPTVVQCAADSMPDRWIGWSQADLVVIADLAWDKVDDRAWKALVEWVKSGGTLLLSPTVEEAWFRDPHLRQLCDLGEVRVKDLRRLPGRFNPGVPVPFASIPSEGGEFIVHRAVEFGHVYVLPFDLAASPFQQWKGLPKLWEAVTKEMKLANPNDLMDRGQAQAVERYYYYGLRDEIDVPMRNAVGYGLRKLPDVWALVICILLFVLLVGPVNFIALRRLKRPLWTIVTIPGISVVFVGSILGMGYWTKGSRTAVQRVAVVNLLSGSDFAAVQRFACVRAAVPGDYEARLDAAEAPRVLAPIEATYDLAQTGQFAIERLPLHMWEEGYLRSDSVRQGGGTIDLSREGGLPVVANRTQRRIRGAVWVDFQGIPPKGYNGAPGVLARFGPIAAGQTVKAEGPLAAAPCGDRGQLCAEAVGVAGLDQAVMKYLLDVKHASGQEAPTLFALVDGDEVPLSLSGRKPQEAGTLTVLVVHER